MARVWELSCSRPGPAGGANRRRSSACRPREFVGAQRRRLRPGSPVTSDGHLLCRDGGKPRTNGMPKKQLRKPSLKTQWPRKNTTGRRRFAPAKPVGTNSNLEARRDGNTTDVCPRHTRRTEGKTQLPHALWLPCWRALRVRCENCVTWCAGDCGWVASPCRAVATQEKAVLPLRWAKAGSSGR